MKTHNFTFVTTAFGVLGLAAFLSGVFTSHLARADEPQHKEPQYGEEVFIQATRELDQVLAAYHTRLRQVAAGEIDQVKINLARDAKQVLEKYGLTSEELARYRREVEAATKAPLKDPAFRGVINKLNE